MVVQACLLAAISDMRMCEEVLAILFALTTFTEELSGQRVVLYSDNCGAQHAATRGSAKSFDHNAMVHEIWEFAFEHQVSVVILLRRYVHGACVASTWQVHLWIERVPSEQNISDSPSRFAYQEMEEIGAQWRAPCFVLGAAVSA